MAVTISPTLCALFKILTAVIVGAVLSSSSTSVTVSFWVPFSLALPVTLSISMIMVSLPSPSLSSTAVIPVTALAVNEPALIVIELLGVL